MQIILSLRYIHSFTIIKKTQLINVVNAMSSLIDYYIISPGE